MMNPTCSRTSPMIHVVFLIVTSGFLIMLSDATCRESGARRLARGQILTGCQDGDMMRELDSKWFSTDCEECHCLPDGSVDCCKKVMKPVLSDPGCEAELNKTTCSYEIRRKDNSNTPCLVRGVM